MPAALPAAPPQACWARRGHPGWAIMPLDTPVFVRGCAHLQQASGRAGRRCGVVWGCARGAPVCVAPLRWLPSMPCRLQPWLLNRAACPLHSRFPPGQVLLPPQLAAAAVPQAGHTAASFLAAAAGPPALASGGSGGSGSDAAASTLVPDAGPPPPMLTASPAVGAAGEGRATPPFVQQQMRHAFATLGVQVRSAWGFLPGGL